MLKARYYPPSNFLNAHVGVNPSFTWRSIMEGKELLLKGIIYKVDSGAFIDMRIDPWLPLGEGYRLQDPG